MDTMVADGLVGRTVDRRYRVEARLAAGGMATVYRATDLRLDRPVALKVMKEDLADDPEFVARFRTEARSAARLAHPTVVAVYDQGDSDGLVYLAMEYVPGRTLRDVLHDSGQLTPEQALLVADQALEALGAAHAAGFVHRDIKPENVLIADTGAVKVTDFGLARALAAPSGATGGVLIGTAAYLAPEQVSLGESDERSDIYQAGVLLYEMLTGSPPHEGDTPWAVAYQHVNTDVPPVGDRRPGLPPALEALVADATARDRAERIGSVQVFLERVRALRAQLPPPAPFARRTTVIVPEATTAAFDRPQDAPTPALDLTDGAQDPPAGSDDPAPSARPRRRWWWAALVVAVLGLATAGLVAYGNPFDRTEVPDVVGATEDKATSSLTALGFTVEVAGREFSEDVRAGRVLGSDPGAGSNAASGATVSLVVSLGPERYEVPRVRGQSPAEAEATLAATNLAVATEKPRYHDSVPEGTVVGTDPSRGTEVRRDTPIMLLVSAGPAPVDVPDLTGTPQSAAESALRDAGLEFTVSTRESTSIDKGDVISTDPRAGTTLLRGDRVELVVSEGPPPVVLPNVVDQPKDQAVAQLEALGLKVRVDEGIVTPLGRVYSTDPPPGTTVAVGSTVTLSIF